MIVKQGHPLFTKVQLVDVTGRVVQDVVYYNTKSKYTRVLVRAGNGLAVTGQAFIGPKSKGNTVAVASARLKGSRLVYKKSGRAVKES